VVLTTASVEVTVLWNVAPCHLVNRYQGFGGNANSKRPGTFYPKDEGSKSLRNVGTRASNGDIPKDCKAKAKCFAAALSDGNLTC